MVITVRRASVADAATIARIRVCSWRVAYPGLIPDVLLERLDTGREAELRARNWRRRNADPRTAQLLALADGEPVGWAATGPCLDDDRGAAARGELYALYAVPEHWSTGVGHALIGAAETALREAGYRTASLWVLEGNERAASFYQRHGWRPDGAVKDDYRIIGTAAIPPLRERRRVRDLTLPRQAHPERPTARLG
ncbi:GNAT family N-acetyltransferase [Microbacterium kribbense]|uniref:GNAT family N-acetyltransferase n=1 Tax=Microbacterium kribbense TaxID=433645 RepID=A0ABP7GI89_9MICO